MTSTFGEQFDSIRPLVTMFAVDDFDAPPLLEFTVDLTPSDGATALPVGDKGSQGDPGEPGRPIDFQWHVTSDDDLPDVSTLGPRDRDKAWANTVTGSLWLWLGTEWMEIPNGLGAPGPVGPPGSIALGTVTTSPPGGVASAEAVGSPLARKLNIVLPRGLKGPDGDVGPSGPIRQAVDYSNVNAPQNGDNLEWDELQKKFKPVTPKRIVGPWNLINDDFSKAVSNSPSQVVAQLDIPPQSFRYKFRVTGLVMINRVTTGARYHAEVVVQSTSQAVARGNRDLGASSASNVVAACTMLPYSGAKVSPGSSANEMPADVAQRLLVQVVRTGTGQYNVASDPGNNIEVDLIPT